MRNLMDFSWSASHADVSPTLCSWTMMCREREREWLAWSTWPLCGSAKKRDPLLRDTSETISSRRPATESYEARPQ